MSRTDTAVGVISASPDRVFAALTDSDALAGWLPPDWSRPREVTPVDARSRVDIRADDVPDGINAADHAAGLSSSLDNLAASVER
ncbi:MAG: hypothetical protein ACRDVN_13670 [Jiangellaceae bacterium]